MASTPTTALDAANEALASIRLSSEHTNGHSPSGNDDTSSNAGPSTPQAHTAVNASAKASATPNTDQLSVLRGELERTRAEKDTLDAHYRTLLEKVTAMRTTLGNKLKQDAVRVLGKL